MYISGKQTPEEKRKQEKMNMVLNNLEQKLGADEDLCQGVARIIDMTIENNELVVRLEEIESNIPEIEQRLLSSCSKARSDLLLKIHNELLGVKDKEKTIEYMLKLQKTIDYCIENYSTYIKSKYYAKYSPGRDSTKNISSMSTEEILMLS